MKSTILDIYKLFHHEPIASDSINSTTII